MHHLPLARSLALLLALSGCVDVGHPFRRGVGPAVARTRATEGAAARAAAERARVASQFHILRHQLGSPHVVGAEGDVTHTLLGPLRIDLRRGIATPAEDISTEPISLALKGPRGWLFVTSTAVYSSATFTGRLRALRASACDREDPVRLLFGPFGPAWLTSHASHGRLALTGVDEGALWSDGQTLHQLDVPGAVSHAWADEARGAVIVGYRTLRVTRDGGRSWRDVDLRGEVPVEVKGDAGGLLVVTDAGRHLIREVDTEHDALIPVMTPAALTLSDFLPSRCFPPHDAAAAGESPAGRAYELAPEPEPRESCGQARARRRVAWSPPSFMVRPRSVARSDDVTAPWVVPGRVRSPLGTPASRTFAEAGKVPMVVSIATPAHPQRGHIVTMAWRGEDDGGPFTTRVRTTVPREVPPDERWTLVAATRRGLLFELYAEELVDLGVDLYENLHTELFWFSAAGVRRMPLSPAGSAGVRGAVATADGGVLVLGAFSVALADLDVASTGLCNGTPHRERRTVMYAMRLGPDGAELARRTTVDDPAVRMVVGLGEVAGRQGLVVAESADPASLTLLPFGGGELPFGAWGFAGAPPVCGDDPAEGVATLHLMHDDGAGVRIGGRPDGSNLASPRLSTFERTGDRVCVRRVHAVQRIGSYERHAQDRRAVWASLRLTARQGRLAGTYDDGVHVAPIEADVGAIGGGGADP